MTEEFEARIDLNALQEKTGRLKTELEKIIIGQPQLIEMLLIAIIANGHVLLEGVPGTAKTLTAKILANALDINFSRIQFTPDLMPSDVIGTNIYNTGKSTFEFKKGPVFSNIVLIDEINRAPAKTQSALLEVMEERQISVDGVTYKTDEPFIIIATQNPIEHEGTYQLPEAQLDRFLFKLNIGYPEENEEEKILELHIRNKGIKNITNIAPVLSAKDILQFRDIIREIRIDSKLAQYIVRIVQKTRSYFDLFLGASPRATINIMLASQALAALNGRDFVTPEDIQNVVEPVLKHRIILTPEKEMEGITPEEIIKMIVKSVEIPR
jgi:MoxR-like ATPase